MSDSSIEPAWRRTTAYVLLIVLFFSAAIANLSVWVQTTISQTDEFVATFEPLPDDVAIAELLGQSIANAAVDTEQTASNLSARLPEELQALSVPIATAVNQLAAGAATRLVESDPFEAIWGRALQSAHTLLIDFITLRSEVRVLVLDVTEAADQLADRLDGLGIEISVPDTTNITILQTNQSPFVISVLRFVYTTGWVFPVLFVALLAGIIFLRTDRRRAVVSVSMVTAGALLFDLVLMRIVRSSVSDQAAQSLGEQAIRSAWDTVTTRLRWQTWIVLLIALVVAGIARYAGSTPDLSPSPAQANYLRRWGTLTQGAVIVLALSVMLLVPSMTLGLALLVAALAALLVFSIEIGKQRAAQPSETPTVTVG